MTAPGPPYAPAQQPVPQSNALAWTSLALGVVALVLCWVPFVNVVSVVLGLVAVVLGLVALRHRRRHGTGGVALGFGVGTGVVAVGVAVVVTLVVGRGLLDELDDLSGNADPPEARGAIGEWVTDEDDPLAYRVDDVRCEPADDPFAETCTIEVSVRNDGGTQVLVRDDMFAAVVDGGYDGTIGPRTLPVKVEAGGSTSLTLSASLFPRERLDGVAFDGSRAETHDSTVVSVR